MRDVPNHIGNAFSSMRSTFSIEGARGVALALLIILTIVASAFGLLDLVRAGEAGHLSGAEQVVVWALAAAAILTMWLALEFAADARRDGPRFIAIAVYLFLTLWSIGFGYGFYWKHFASVERAQEDLGTMSDSVNRTLGNAIASLSNVQRQINNVSTAAANSQRVENAEGGSCDGMISEQGRGPLWVARQSITNRTGALTSSLTVWIGGGGEQAPARESGERSLAQEIQAVRDQATAIQQRTEGVGANAGSYSEQQLRADLRAVRDNALSVMARTNGVIDGRQTYIDQIETLRDDIRLGIPTTRGPCRDEALAATLSVAAQTLSELRRVDGSALENFDPPVGARATQAAFYRLWRNLFYLGHVSEADRIGEKDWIALIAAIAVDVGIAFLTLFGRRNDPIQGLATAVRARLRDGRLRRELERVGLEDGERIRRAFDSSWVTYKGRVYLVSTPQIPELHDSIRNIQNALRAAREGYYVSAPGMIETRWGLLKVDLRNEGRKLEAFQERLAETAQRIADEGRTERPLGPEEFEARYMQVMLLTSQVVLSVQLALTAPQPSRPAPAQTASNASQYPPPGGPPSRPKAKSMSEIMREMLEPPSIGDA